MDLQAFFMENAGAFPEEELAVSARFQKDGKPLAFKIRGISEEENGRIRCQCWKGGEPGEVDSESYFAKLAAACVVEPDLENAALQRSWGVMGAENLLRRMLSAGEFAKLLERVQAVCGFDVPVSELAGELKNGSWRATSN